VVWVFVKGPSTILFRNISRNAVGSINFIFRRFLVRREISEKLGIENIQRYGTLPDVELLEPLLIFFHSIIHLPIIPLFYASNIPLRSHGLEEVPERSFHDLPHSLLQSCPRVPRRSFCSGKGRCPSLLFLCF